MPHDCLWADKTEQALFGAKLVWVEDGARFAKTSKVDQILDWFGLRRNSGGRAPGVNHVVAYETSAAKMAGHLAAYLVRA